MSEIFEYTRFHLPNVFYLALGQLDYIERTYDSNRCNTQDHWDRSTNCSEVVNDIVDGIDHQLG